MNDETCKVPREDLDDGFNPCRKQVVENGELCQYAHMYDVMNERYDREEDTSYLDSVKRDRINQSTPKQTADGGKLYAQDAQGVEGFVKSSGTLDPTTHAEIPSSKAVADYAPIPLPVSKGGTGGNTPYRTDDLDNSAIFVMHDAPNDRYDAAPMSALTGYLDNRYNPLIPSYRLTGGSDLNNIQDGTYYTGSSMESNNLLNKPNHTFLSSVRVDQYANGSVTDTRSQIISENQTGTTYYRYRLNNVWSDWTLLYPTPSRNILIPPNSDLNDYKTPGKYAVEGNIVVPSIINTPINLTKAFNIYVFPALTENYYIGQQLTTYDGSGTYYRFYSSSTNEWRPWTLLYPTPSSTIPNPLPVSMGGTGAQTRSLKTAAGLTLLPVIDSIGASGALNGYTSVTNIATFITTNNIRPEITAAFDNHTADAVANNDLLPTNALMMDYVGNRLVFNVQSSSVEIDIPQGEKVEENYTNIQCNLNQVVVYQGGYTLEHDTDVIEVWPHVSKTDVGYEYRFGYHVYSLIDNPPKRTVVLNFLTVTLGETNS